MAGEAVLSAFLQALFEKLVTAALSEATSLHRVAEELQDLSSTLSLIQAFLEDAEEKQSKDKLVRSWLAKLKDVAYDMDDLLDQYEAKALGSNLEVRGQSYWKKQVRNYFYCSCWYKLSFRNQMANRMNMIKGRLSKIVNDQHVLGLRVLGSSNPIEITERPQTSSLVDDSSVLGREEDKENLVKLLLSVEHSSNSRVSVLPIVGMGGLGKTTLAQLVYNDPRVEDHFQLRMWVCVSENFDEMKLTKETLESATNGSEYASATTNMNLLQEDLSGKLKGKKFLLVLDDVWNEDDTKWSRFRKALIVGKKGSKIIVTTQNENVGRMMGGLTPFRLNRLSDDDCWILFRNYAFVGGDSSRYPTLEEIGKGIVKKLKGLPLAAKALGCILYSKLDEEDWKSILRSEIWELPPERNNILPALRLSYKYLPPHLKQCFAFCSVFHKDYVFEKDKLVQIWMALGFIQPQGRKRLEDIGNRYFDDLLSRSFFQPYKGNYVMHDAIHDLAQSISIDECLQLENVTRHIGPKRAHHLSFSCKNYSFTSFETFYEFKSLRTLLFLRGYKSPTCSIPETLFQKLRCLRVLELYRRNISLLPHSIGNLLQLRYLGLSGTDIRQLPSSISRLCNLQTLKLGNCNLLDEIPKGVTNLINLRHLEANNELISKVEGLGQLIHLQKLDEFIVRKNKGHSIKELKNMVELRGRLCIQNVENVNSGKEATEAKMSAKEHLGVLDILWSDNRKVNFQDEYLDEEVLEGLQPHPELKELMIKGYAGVMFPIWLGSPAYRYLQTIHLSNCMKCKLLPPLGQLPFLLYLDIVGVYEVTRIGEEFLGIGEINGFPSLNELVLEDLPELEEWFYAEDYQLFPRLSNLEIVDCPKLKKVPRIPPTLTKLRIFGVGFIALPEIWFPSNSTTPSSSLLSLHIHDCPNLLSLQQGLLGQQLLGLKELKITNCEELVSLPHECFQSLSSLKTLHIYNCQRLVVQEGVLLLPTMLEDLRINSCSNLINQLLAELKNLHCLTYLKITDCEDFYCFPEEELPVTLKFLGIMDCTSLRFLPSRLNELSSLETLVISNCPQIPSLPDDGLPEMLQEIYISGCPLLKDRLRKSCESDWFKICHVPYVEIDGETAGSFTTFHH